MGRKKVRTSLEVVMSSVDSLRNDPVFKDMRMDLIKGNTGSLKTWMHFVQYAKLNPAINPTIDDLKAFKKSFVR